VDESSDHRIHKSPLKSLKGDICSESSDDSNSDYSINSQNMEWRLGDYINTGSIGAVYRALDCNTAKLITIKFLDIAELDGPRKDEIIEKFKDEVNKIKLMKDPNIVRYIDVTKADDEEGMFAILMEYIPGGSISYLLKFFKSFKEPLVKIYIGQVAKVLSRLHGKGIIHRDLKPDNLMVDDFGTVKLSDFGFIKSIYRELCPNFSQDLDIQLIDKRETNGIKSIPDHATLEKLIASELESGEPLKPLVNSYYYCPPEVINQNCKKLDPSYDIWSLG
jgi:serine/threonine protein kinase